MRAEYQQLELDTRRQVDIAIERVTGDAIKDARDMIETSADAPAPVRNRHEAYGIAAEQYAKIASAVKKIKSDLEVLLGTLPDPNFPAIEATSTLCNSTATAAGTLIKAAAEMRRTLDNLYIAETSETDNGPTPMELLAAEGAAFEEAEPAEADEDGEAEPAADDE